MKIKNQIFLAALCVAFTSATLEPASAQETPRRKGNIVGRVAPNAASPSISKAMASKLPAVIQVSQDKARMILMPVPVRKIVIGNEKIADIHIDKANPNQVFIVSKSIGSTNVFFMDGKGQIIHKAEVRVALNPNALRAALSDLIPDEKIDVTVFNDSIFLSGNVKSAPAAADAARIAKRFVTAETSVTNMIKVIGSQQVILQVHVSEMDRGIRKNLSANAKLGLNSFLGDLDITTSSPSTTLAAFGSGVLSHDISPISPATISALERQSLIKTLAEPTLTARSGETASFISGGQIPVPIGVDGNGNAIIDFKDYGISLSFTPVVLSKGRISLKISTEISEVDSTTSVTVSSLSINGFKTKRTESTVDLQSGGSLMLSGLLESNVTNTIYGLPFFKDLPVLGALFRSTEFQRDETELVVTITAYLAKPTGAGAPLALPTDGFEPASDIDIYLLGRLHREYGKGDRAFWDDPVKGPFGYIMK